MLVGVAAARGAAAQGAGAPAPRAGVTQSYDPATGRTTLRATLPDVGAGVALTARAEWEEGAARQAPDSVTLFLTRAGAARVLRPWDTMELIAQGDRATVIVVGAPAISARSMGTGVVEQVGATIAAADLERLAAARAVVGKVGALTFWIAGSAHDALREFAARARE
jgi:hypothetical protein